MSKPNDLPMSKIDLDDIGYNESPNESFSSVLAARVSRRGMLKGGFASVAGAMLGSVGLAACGGSSDSGSNPTSPPQPTEKLLSFNAVSKSLADAVIVPAGYTASVIYALGDPLRASTPAFKNDGTDTDFENRAGDHHDGMEWFGLDASGRPSASSNDRGLLGVNHEATTDETKSSFFLHANGGTSTLPRPASEVDKELAIHGVSVVEVRKTGNNWQYLKDSSFNFRITQNTEVDISGPARGNALLITKFSPNGDRTRGTLNNCGTGKTPWGTLVTGEENWAGYFFRATTDDAARNNDKTVTSLKRYGRAAGAASRHGWESVPGGADQYARWDISKVGTSTDGSDDYRNEINTMGFLVEVDPYDKTKKAKKRTGLGRFAKESAGFSPAIVGKPLAVYLGDDSRGEYIYKWVSTATWTAADANATDRLAVGDKFLDSGKLYVAKYMPDGTGTWTELTFGLNGLTNSNGTYPFADQADVCLNTRIAGDIVGATKMDRPEWGAVNPANGEVYFALTNNTSRRVDPTSSSQFAPDSANPRVYTDMKGTTAQQGNPNGHILRMREGASGSTALTFTWDVYLFGAEANADKSKINLSSLTDDQDFSSPDGLVFTPSTGICWIQTDDGAYTDVTNCMMLAAIPGNVGDGTAKVLSYTKADSSNLSVVTHVGKTPTNDTLKRFLVGPSACEITGLCETPDGKALFLNIQHPGENTKMADVTDPTKYTSQWPSNAGYGAGSRPRSATVVITKNDGGRIGS